MRVRSRNRPSRSRNGSLNGWGPWSPYSDQVCEYIREDPVPGGNKCFHSKALDWSGVHNLYHCAPPSYGSYYVQSEGNPFRGAPTDFPSYLASYIPLLPLNHSKLPTSSEFGIIQFFAELDDTLAMFTKKFFRELSYGSLTWGVMPFVRDIQSIMDMIRNLNANLSNHPYEDELSGSFSQACPCGQAGESFEGEFTVRLTGSVNYQFADDILILYDRLGFHPDIGTAWDLVPLSFVVDWFLPVGDLLDRLYDRGWITSALFTGWRTLSVKYIYGATGTTYGVKPFEPYEIFMRDYLQSSLITAYEAAKPIQLKRPSFKQLFNTAYIARLGKYF